MKGIFTYLKGDKVIWMIVLILSLLSFISVYSFTPILTKPGIIEEESFLLKHVMMIVTGFALMFYVHNINFKYFSRISQIGIWLAVALLFITLVSGVKINSAERWLHIPVLNINFQTSDFAKIILLVFVARMVTVNREKLDDFKEGIVPILIPALLIIGLILPQNFSTAALVFAMILILMFIGNVPIKHIALIIGGAIVLFLLMILIAKVYPDFLPRLETWTNRLFNYNTEDPTKQWQTNNALMAIDNGGVFGRGPGNGQMKLIIPEAYADFVFASFVEEFGMIGGGFLVMLFLILFYRIVRIASKCESVFGSLVVIGLGLNLMFMTLINMLVCTELIPVTGQNIPLISMGGTSTWFTCISLGIIQSVSRTVEEAEIEKANSGTHNTKKEDKGGSYAVA